MELIYVMCIVILLHGLLSASLSLAETKNEKESTAGCPFRCSSSISSNAYNCDICHYKVTVTNAMLAKPSELLSDLSLLCDLDTIILSYFNVNGNFHNDCQFLLMAHLLKTINGVASSETKSLIFDAEIFLGIYSREYITNPVKTSLSLTNRWRPSAAIIMMFDPQTVVESRHLQQLFETMKRHWYDKSLWLETTIHLLLQSHECNQELINYLPEGVMLQCHTQAQAGELELERLNLAVRNAYLNGTEFFFIVHYESLLHASTYHDFRFILHDIFILRNSRFGPHIGIVFNEISNLTPLNPSFSHANSIAFHRHHMDALQLASNRSSCFDLNFSLDDNLAMMHEAYRTFNASFCFCEEGLEIRSGYLTSLYGIMQVKQDTFNCAFQSLMSADNLTYSDQLSTLRFAISDWKNSRFQVKIEATLLPDMQSVSSTSDIFGSVSMSSFSKVAVITAIFGGYERSCKPFMHQTMSTDFICFTDDPTLNSNGWQLDTKPYHNYDASDPTSHVSSLDGVNALKYNQHPFNIAKYYKTHFHTIPRLASYDVVIWIDGTIGIENENFSALVYDLVVNQGHNIPVFEHSRDGYLHRERDASIYSGRYLTELLHGRPQPLQDVGKQYEDYKAMMHQSLEPDSMNFWGREMYPHRQQYGVFVTCFFAIDMKKKESFRFLEAWYAQIVKYTTQDQLSFPFVAHMLNIYPYPLPHLRKDISQSSIHGHADVNSLFTKLHHSQ